MSDSSNDIQPAVALFLAGVCLARPLGAAPPDPAKDYPNKPIRFIVHSVAGGGTDITARAIAQKLTEAWGQQVVVDNRTGAAGTIAVDLAARAIPDGYTITTIAASQVSSAAVNPKLPYDFTRDLVGISQASSLPLVVYHHPSVPLKSIKDLIAYAKANPGKLNYGSAGTGSMQHLSWELFGHMTGTRLVHVPYKGGAAQLAALLPGDIQIAMSSLITIRPHLPSGRVRAIAVTGRQRSAATPELPTVAESGVTGYEADQWYGVIASAKVHPAIVRKLSTGIATALKSPEVAQRLATDGSTPVGSTPEQFSAHIKSELAKWGKLAKDIGLVLN